MKHAIVRSALLALVMLGAGAVAAYAQEPETPAGDVFLGYSYLHTDGGANVNGFDASVTGNLNDWFGLQGEASGHYKGGGYLHYALGGPKFTVRTAGARVEPFVHTLVGGAFINSEAAFFAVAVGGGVDVKLNDKVAIRAIQADYAPIISGGHALHNARVSAGVVFRF